MLGSIRCSESRDFVKWSIVEILQTNLAMISYIVLASMSENIHHVYLSWSGSETGES